MIQTIVFSSRNVPSIKLNNWKIFSSNFLRGIAGSRMLVRGTISELHSTLSARFPLSLQCQWSDTLWRLLINICHASMRARSFVVKERVSKGFKSIYKRDKLPTLRQQTRLLIPPVGNLLRRSSQSNPTWPDSIIDSFKNCRHIARWHLKPNLDTLSATILSRWALIKGW